MGNREIRRVPPGFEHPRDEQGKFIPLHDGLNYLAHLAAWHQNNQMWNEGYTEDYSISVKLPGPGNVMRRTYWCPKDDNQRKFLRYEDWSEEPRPDPKNYTSPRFLVDCTHFMWYETVSEGTPVSPVFATKDMLMGWIENN